MPGEISRQNPGPKGNTPYVPSWICLEGPGEAYLPNPVYCRVCGNLMRKHKGGNYEN